jgi:heme iron utilization protein
VSERGVLRELGTLGRQLLRRGGRAALATSLNGAPYASLVLYAADLDASPLLLLSDLAQHSRNIAFDPRVSLLLDGTAELAEPLSGPRLTLLGQAEAIADPRSLARFTARHPGSRDYAGFADFKLRRVAIERGHIVAGFGRIAWIARSELLFCRDTSALAAAEPAILAILNENLREILARCVARQLGGDGAGWRATGCDPEGIDIRCGDGVARLEFTLPISTPDEIGPALAEIDRFRGPNR